MGLIKATIRVGVLGVFCLGVAMPAAATEETAKAEKAKKERDWSVSFTPYLWAVGMNLKVDTGPIDESYGVGLLTILENLKGIAMADMEVRYKRVGIIGDGMWARLGSSQNRSTPTGSIDIDADLNLAWGTGAAYYRFRPTEKLSLDPYIAARWWRVDTQLDLTDNGVAPPPPRPPVSGEDTVAWADPVFGLRVNYDITDKWSVRAAADVGGGVSKVSWQALGGGAYKITDWVAIDVLYRVMGVDYQPSGNKYVLKLNGLAIGATFSY